jgi:hypothetical protein
MLNLILLIAGAGLLIYALIHRPEIFAVVLFVLVIAGIDVLYLRPVMTLALFGRIIVFDKPSTLPYPSFIKQPFVKLLIIFLLYGMMVSFYQGLLNYDLIKGDIDTLTLTYCVYYYFFKFHNANVLRAALIVSGLICFADLGYTYLVYGSFPVHRIYFEISGAAKNLTEDDLQAMANWNFFGQICGMTFVYVLGDFIKNRSSKSILWFLPVVLSGVFMSTSRSAILALLIVTIWIILSSINYREQKRRVAKVGAFSLGAAAIGFLLLATVGKYVSLDSKFIDEITSRLSQEPIAIVKKALGESYDIHDLGSMDWREESAENAYAAYMNMDWNEQFFGIGIKGFQVRNLGHGYNAHNATLLLLIENGIAGFMLYFMLVGGVIFRSLSIKNLSPALFVVCFILIYGLGQNREWTGWTTFLFVFCVVAEIQYLRMLRRERYALTEKEIPVGYS